jgi:ElaB/YqjD/DUF883 family membrane-anchored ribosome-binding protein
MTRPGTDAVVTKPGDVAANDALALADAAADKLKDVTERALEVAGKVAEQAQAYGDRAQELMTQVKPYIEKSIKEQPLATLALAAALGIVVGALWKK